MLVVSSREFREKQAEYMDRVDNGEQVIVQRGKNKAYSITPITEDDLYFTPRIIDRIKEAQQEIRDGNGIAIKTKEELNTFFDRL